MLCRCWSALTQARNGSIRAVSHFLTLTTEKQLDILARRLFSLPTELLEKTWATPSDTVHVDSIDRVRINQPISAFIVFSGCQATPTGKCNVSMAFRVIQPDGKVYATTSNMEVWQDQDAPGSALALSVQYLRIRIEPHEPRGRYTVYVEVRDNNSGKVLALKKTFTASEV